MALVVLFTSLFRKVARAGILCMAKILNDPIDRRVNSRELFPTGTKFNFAVVIGTPSLRVYGLTVRWDKP